MNRRQFIQISSTLSLSYGLNLNPLFAAINSKKNPMLILIELKGGNDGLNTFVPMSDPNYKTLRPKLNLNENETIQINQEYALHTSLKHLHQSYKNNELAIIQGLGYPKPNLSHFRSIDIWDTASDSQEFLEEGWISKCLKQLSYLEKNNAVIIGDANLGPMQGFSIPPIIYDQFNKKNQTIKNMMETSKNINLMAQDPLEHIINIENQLNPLIKLSNQANDNKTKLSNLPAGNLGKSIQFFQSMLSVGYRPRVVKFSIGGFDTHTFQKNKHQKLLKNLDLCFASLTTILKNQMLWENSLLMTYSEFGRRAQENKNQGTDHGTSNVHFAMGGKINAGIYGKEANLNQLNKGNLIYTTDFRQIFSTIINKHFKLDAKKTLGKNWDNISFIS